MNLPRLFAFPLVVFGACSALAGPLVDQSGRLTDDHGMTLYVYKHDMAGAGRCNDKCLRPWPPYAAPARAQPLGEFSVVRREGGRAQWAYKGQPLHRFAGDAAPGDLNGDNAGAAWSIVRSKAVEQRTLGSASDYAF